MSERRILTLALTLTSGLGVLFFVLASRPAEATHKPAAASPSPTISASPKGEPSASAPSAKTSVSPTASTSPLAGGKFIVFRQTSFKSQSSGSPVALDKLPVDPKGVDQKLWPYFFGQAPYPGAGNITFVRWDQFRVLQNLNVAGQKNAAQLRRLRGSEREGYFISDAFHLGEGTTQWVRFSYRTGNNSAGDTARETKIYYRVSDEATSDLKAADWIPAPPIPPPRCNPPARYESELCLVGSRGYSMKIDKTGKYFQLKLQRSGNLSPAFSYAILAAAGGSTTSSPTPSADKGKITVITRKLLAQASPTPSVSPTPSGPPLPELTPTPSPSPSLSPSPTAKVSVTPTVKTSSSPIPDAINPICFANHETEPAPNIRLSVRQTSGGSVRVTDQETDEEGVWHGLAGETDEFPAGTYSVDFGEFQKSDYKLVALCVEPNDGQHHLKTQTAPTTRRATVIVKPGETTEVTALYAPRNKPFISMSKFALGPKNKLLRFLFPGTGFNYLVRYENTGDADAKDVVIRDVIAEQFYVPGTDEETLDNQEAPFTTSIDVRGRTIITKIIGSLRRGQKGSFVIPVILRPDAFGKPDDIAGFLREQRAIDSSPPSGLGTPSSPASKPSAPAGTGSGSLIE